MDIPGYDFFNNYSNSLVGGFGIYVCDSLKCDELPNMRMNVKGSEDVVWVQIGLNLNESLLGPVYRHPNSDIRSFENVFVNTKPVGL